jgi:hypothetical protein
MMVVRNIFEIAPRVRFFDCPLLPEHIADIPVFLDLAEAAYQRMIVDIKALRKIAEYGGPWIFVNAWAIYDRKTEWPAGDYTNGPDHPFNKLVTSAVRGNIDVLFCAGNCGAFCPSSHCGANDRGPGNSILGANSHPHVITVGAVRTDTIWVGFSSEGPGQSNLDRDKPDLCAPSQFSETGDAHTSNGGTSAACALTAGVVAGLRSRWGASVLPPAFLKLVLKQTAMKQYDNWQAEVRLGSGIMNAEAAYNEISRLVP